MTDPSPHVPRAADLLVHGAWLRRLARGLVRDAQSAEDLVQETWLVAMRGGPRRPESARAWLRSVVRNIARQTRRGEARRRLRESRASRAEAEMGEERTRERLELASRLTEHLRALPEPYRSTLVWRYYDGLTPAQIAARTQTSVRTVESRLRRGLARMRETLDREHSGGRSQWLGATVLFAAGRQGGSGSAVPAPLLLGAGATLAITLVALGIRFANVRPAGEGLIGSSADPPAPTEEAAAAGALANSADGFTADGSARVALRGREPNWQGRLTRERDGSPLAGVAAELRTRYSPIPLALVSDAGGILRFPWSDEEARGESRLHVAATESTRAVSFPIGGNEELVELVVPARGGRLHGRCVDQVGAPCAGATVLAWRTPPGTRVLDGSAATATARCAVDGSFSIDDLGDENGGWTSVAVFAHGRDLALSKLESTRVRAAEQGDSLDLVLHSGTASRIRVRGPDGAPERGVHAAWDAGPFALLFAADREGEIELPWWAIEGVFEVHSERHPLAQCTLTPGGDVLVRLGLGEEFSGVLRDEHGRALHDATVELFARESRSPTVSDHDGRFRFSGLTPGGERAIRLRAHDCARAERYATTPREDVWRAPPGGVVHGRLWNQRRRRGLAGIEIAVEGIAGRDLGDGWHALAHEVCSTSATGEFAFSFLPLGPLEIVARHRPQGRVLARVTVEVRRGAADGGAPSIEIVAGMGLEDCAELHVTARGRDELPIRDLMLVCSPLDSAGGRRGSERFLITSADGRFTAGGLPAGRWLVRALSLHPEPEELEPGAGGAEVVLAPRERRPIEFHPPGTLAESGEPR